MPRDAQDTPDGGKQPRLSKFIGKIADIEAADLTDQQLRAARKLAAKRGIAASSDLDAVQQLRALVARGKTGAGKRSKAPLPHVVMRSIQPAPRRPRYGYAPGELRV